MTPHKYPVASWDDVLRWLQEGIFTIHEGGRVYKGAKLLKARILTRNRMEGGDPRVDLWHENKRRSCAVSRLVWMANTGRTIPEGFEIHHRDEDSYNNSWENLICIFSGDHQKLHNGCHVEEEEPW